MDFFLTYRVANETPVNREPAKCSELVWAKSSNLPDDLIPYVRAAIDYTHREGFWIREYGWKSGREERAGDLISTLRGCVIAESLVDPMILNRFPICGAQITKEGQDLDASGRPTRWHLYWVRSDRAGIAQ